MISVIIPTRPHESVDRTVDSLMHQTISDLEIQIIVDYDRRGAPWARNRGSIRGSHVLYCDNDVVWEPNALQLMRERLELAVADGPDEYGWRVGYAYGSYQMRRVNGSFSGQIGGEPWSLDVLRGRNFISTMSLIDVHVLYSAGVEFHKLFDENLDRLQDYDVWLTLALEYKIKGVSVNAQLFWTAYREGITYGKHAVDYDDAFKRVRSKHGLA